MAIPWEIPWTEEPRRLQSMGLQVGQNWAAEQQQYTSYHTNIHITLTVQTYIHKIHTTQNAQMYSTPLTWKHTSTHYTYTHTPHTSHIFTYSTYTSSNSPTHHTHTHHTCAHIRNTSTTHSTHIHSHIQTPPLYMHTYTAPWMPHKIHATHHTPDHTQHMYSTHAETSHVSTHITHTCTTTQTCITSHTSQHHTQRAHTECALLVPHQGWAHWICRAQSCGDRKWEWCDGVTTAPVPEFPDP